MYLNCRPKYHDNKLTVIISSVVIFKSKYKKDCLSCPTVDLFIKFAIAAVSGIEIRATNELRSADITNMQDTIPLQVPSSFYSEMILKRSFDFLLQIQQMSSEGRQQWCITTDNLKPPPRLNSIVVSSYDIVCNMVTFLSTRPIYFMNTSSYGKGITSTVNTIYTLIINAANSEQKWNCI
jgi:hypothetical protein